VANSGTSFTSFLKVLYSRKPIGITRSRHKRQKLGAARRLLGDKPGFFTASDARGSDQSRDREKL
jgi:hypothetical protein